ncbi:MAG: HIRAN domain-containing protein [Sulfuritalea sp.]|nr:HIRAN domain-containing protein [Sulfuritalea sp.]
MRFLPTSGLFFRSCRHCRIGFSRPWRTEVRPTTQPLSGRRAASVLLQLGVGIAISLTALAAEVRILVQSSPLAGFQYHAGEALWQELREGDRLTLVREADNPHDGNAVRIEWRGHKLGYLPRAENRAVAAAMDGGEPVDARIAKMRQHRNPWQRVLIEVFVVL